MEHLIESLPEPIPPRLWNPNAAAAWSLLLSPAFGAWLHATNWRALGNRENARLNLVFFWLYLLFAAADLATILVPHWHMSAGTDRLAQFIAIGLLVGWYVSIGRAQSQHLKEYDISYEKKSWALPLVIAFTATAAYLLAVFALAIVTDEPDVDEISDQLRQSILEDWHDKEELKNATIKRILLEPKADGKYRARIEVKLDGKVEWMLLEVTYKNGTLSYEFPPLEDETKK